MGAIDPLWISCLVISHLLGAFLLLYAIEKVNGGVSRCLRRLLRRPVPATPRTPGAKGGDTFSASRPGVGAALAASRSRAVSSSVLYADDSVTGAASTAQPEKPSGAALAPAWCRGCTCEVSGDGERGERARAEARLHEVAGAALIAHPTPAFACSRPGLMPGRASGGSEGAAAA